MMFISLGIGTVAAVALIVVVSILTGAPAKTQNGEPVSALVGTTIKKFEIGGVNGTRVQMPWATGHPTVLVFFARTCSICHTEMPKVAAYLRAHDVSPVKVVGDDNNETLTDARWFVRTYDITFPVAFDPADSIISGIFGFQGDPYTVFLNKHGVVEQVNAGAISVKQLASGIAALKSDS
jgi:peroxiredoxin